MMGLADFSLDLGEGVEVEGEAVVERGGVDVEVAAEVVDDSAFLAAGVVGEVVGELGAGLVGGFEAGDMQDAGRGGEVVGHEVVELDVDPLGLGDEVGVADGGAEQAPSGKVASRGPSCSRCCGVLRTHRLGPRR